MKYYFASCLFTARFPELSLRIQEYIRSRGDIEIVRCCIPKFRVKENAERIGEPAARRTWDGLPESAPLAAGDIVYSVCHNCTNIAEESNPGVRAVSLWELVDGDAAFPFPNCSGLKATVQDCWRTRERSDEQDAVRSLLRKLQIDFVENPANRGDTDFCGCTLYREQPWKNPHYAPKHYVEQAAGLFQPHTAEEQAAIMREYCGRYRTETVICYCHYCLEGLLAGGVDGRHLADLLFPRV